MKTIFKFATALALTGVVALATATPGEAGHRHNSAAAIGFGVGALAGAALASSAYNHGYYYGYYDDPGYVYAPDYAYDSYGYVYEAAPRYGYWSDWSRQHSTNNFSIDSQR